MPPTIEHDIYLLAKHYFRIGLGNDEMVAVASIIIYQHDHPQAQLAYAGIPAVKGIGRREAEEAIQALVDKQLLILTPIISTEQQQEPRMLRGIRIPQLKRYHYDFSPLIERIHAQEEQGHE